MTSRLSVESLPSKQIVRTVASQLIATTSLCTSLSHSQQADIQIPKQHRPVLQLAGVRVHNVHPGMRFLLFPCYSWSLCAGSRRLL